MTPVQSIIKFNKDRNLLTFNGPSELRMLTEELHELREALEADDEHEIIDALNDLIFLATGALWKLKQDPTLSLKQTCKEVLSRNGSIDTTTGKWQKDPNQDPSELYKADYKLSRR